jgi:ferredoxin--NADP+ reductase
VHGCREVAELGYGAQVVETLRNDEVFGPLAEAQLRYYPTVTREAFRNTGRISTLMATGKLQDDLGLPPLDPAADRVMLCGSPDMLNDLSTLLTARGFTEGSHAASGEFVIEKAFVEK